MKKNIDKGSFTVHQGAETIKTGNVYEELAKVLVGKGGAVWDENGIFLFSGGIADQVVPEFKKTYPQTYLMNEPKFAGVIGGVMLGRMALKHG